MMINHFFNKIYYAYSKIENEVRLTKSKSDFSWGMIIEIIAGFELGIGALIASIPTYLFIRNYFDYIVAIPFALLALNVILLRRYVFKIMWVEPNQEPNQELWEKYEKELSVFKWYIIGIITEICSVCCALGGGLLFMLSLFHIYEQ